MKEVLHNFLMNLTFFTKLFSRCMQSSSSFAKTFLFVREACKYIDKGNYVAMYRKKKTFVSVAFLMALSKLVDQKFSLLNVYFQSNNLRRRMQNIRLFQRH